MGALRRGLALPLRSVAPRLLSGLRRTILVANPFMDRGARQMKSLDFNRGARCLRVGWSPGQSGPTKLA
jgi:hypothetical protein